MRIVPYQILAGGRLLQRAMRLDVRTGLYPGVLAATAALHVDDAGVGSGRDPGQSAWHHDIAVRRGAGKYAKADGASAQTTGSAGLPDWRLRQAYQFLRHIIFGIGAHSVDKRSARITCQVFAKDGKLPELRETRFDDKLVQPFDHRFQRCRLAAPPGRYRGHF